MTHLPAGVLLACAVLSGAALAADHKPRAELQVALCEPQDALERKLDLRPRGPSYETWLFDDAALSLLDHGLRLRLRARFEGGELTLKIAAQDCAALPKGAVPKREGKCEFDVYDGKPQGAVSLSRALDVVATRDLIAGRLLPGDALSAPQAAYLRNVAHVWPLPSGLRPLGPIANRVYAASGYDIDVSTLPGGERYAEISVKVPLAALDGERRKLDAHLAKADVATCADQQGQAANKLRRLLGRP